MKKGVECVGPIWPPKIAYSNTPLIGSVVISLSRGCLSNDEGPGPQIFFPRTATGIDTIFIPLRGILTELLSKNEISVMAAYIWILCKLPNSARVALPTTFICTLQGY